MRKHIMRFVCLLLMVAVLVPFNDAHASCSHNFVPKNIPATCTQVGSSYEECTHCKMTRNWVTLPMLAHTWSGWSVDIAPTCAVEGREKRTCTVCSTPDYRSLGYTGHTWGGYVVTTPPTCFAAGQATDTCSVCKTTRYQSIAKLTHNWSGYVVTTPPTCTVAGVQTSTCSICGSTRTLPINALGHNWGGYVVTKPPTCTDTGLEKRTCSTCGYEEFRMINATGHTWTAWGDVKAATCTDMGEQKRVCTVCSASQLRYVKALGHNWGPWSVSVPPTCTQYGQEKRACTRCSAEQTRRLSRAKHQPRPGWFAMPEPTLEKPGRKVQYCSVCNKMINSKEYAPENYRYNMPATGFGPFAYQFNTRLVGSSDRLIPLDFASGDPITLPIVTADNYYVGDLHVRLNEHVVTVDYQMNDSRTVVSNASYLLFTSLDELHSGSIGYGTQGYPMESAVPFTGDKGILAVRMTINYDRKNTANRPFPEDGMYVDGSTLNSEVLRQMVLKLSESVAPQQAQPAPYQQPQYQQPVEEPQYQQPAEEYLYPQPMEEYQYPQPTPIPYQQPVQQMPQYPQPTPVPYQQPMPQYPPQQQYDPSNGNG